jgi:vacuolar-type H+-ATPase catalytic subunit A/Vma1
VPQPGAAREASVYTGVSCLLHRGDEISRMMQVTGEEGVSEEDFVTRQKSLRVDMVYLQQDAFDAVDVSTDSFKNLNYAAMDTDPFRENWQEIEQLLRECEVTQQAR